MAERQQVFASQITELNSTILEESCILFDPENIILEGSYVDEISAFRAKKGWVEALETYFLLANSRDFSVKITSDSSLFRFKLSCSFSSACARYAFWRLTNQQAPEAQYLIETAHVPKGASQHERFLTAPDMRQISQDADKGPLVIGTNVEESRSSGPLALLLEKILAQLKVKI